MKAPEPVLLASDVPRHPHHNWARPLRHVVPGAGPGCWRRGARGRLLLQRARWRHPVPGEQSVAGPPAFGIAIVTQ